MKRRIIPWMLAASLLCMAIPCSPEIWASSLPQENKVTPTVPKPILPNVVEENQYMAKGESIIHNDVYSSDVTSQIMPLGIYPEIISSAEIEADKAIPCFFYDSQGNCITPYSLVTEQGTISGGIAIRNVDSDPIETLGSFLPVRDDEGQRYGIQISYSFVDNNGFVTGATTHGHVLMIRTQDENGDILPVFEKAIDVDILTEAKKQLGDDIDPNLMSVIMDYEGNLWFTTGGFRIDPAYANDGFFGYVDREYIDLVLSGEAPDAGSYIHTYRLGKGEGIENGISSHPMGCVILTNQACYLLHASQEGVEIVWRTEYESTGGQQPVADSEITGAGLAWGGGSTPTLSEELVLFTDNQDPVNLLALDIETGEVVAQHPVFEGMEDVKVAVENSIIVYSGDTSRISSLVCNWYGAGNTGLYAEDADSSVQSYSNLYDENWINNGSDNLEPGIERIDTIKDGSSYTMESVWQRADICDTSMFKLSTATGYLYGYTEIDGVWQYLVLDWDTGETVMSVPVSTLSRYNNMAVGMMQGNDGNSLYVPTNNMELLCLKDRFAYLPEKFFEELDIMQMDRELLTTEEFQQASGTSAQPVSYLHSAEADSIYEPTLLAFRINGLEGDVSDLQLFLRLPDGSLAAAENWDLTDEEGNSVAEGSTLDPGIIYEVRVTAEDGNAFDLDETAANVKIAMILASEKITGQ